MKTTNRLVIGCVLVLALALTAVSCSFAKHKENAEKAVAKFHEQMNTEHYPEMYSQSDKLFQQAISEADAIALFGAVHSKLGTVKNATLQGWHVNTTTDGTFVTLQYAVEFSEGKGTEQFGFKVSANQALLVNYNVNSPLLITK